MANWRRRRAAEGWTTGGRLRKLILGCWMMLLLVCLMAVGSAQLQLENIRLLTLVQIPAVDANSHVLQAMTDAQTGLNAYQVSGNRMLLQPYFGAQDRTLTALAVLQDKLLLEPEDNADTPRHEALADGQRLAAEQWWADALNVEQAVSRGERSDAFQGRALFDRFRGANAALHQQLTNDRDQSRIAARAMLSRGEAATVGAAVLSLLAMLVLGGRVARSIDRPLTDLRDAVVSQRKGEQDARAREDQGSSEIRSVATSFNELSEQHAAMQQTQTRALVANQITSEIGRSIRAASDIQEVLDVMCAQLGARLGADRVIGSAFPVGHVVLYGAQWHRPDLPPLGELAMLPELGEVAEQMWLSSESQTRDDLLVAELELTDPLRVFCQLAGARASIMVPIGLGDRVIGMIYVLMVSGPRAWDISDTEVVKVVAGFVARALVEAENQAHQLEYVERVERLDRLKTDFLSTVSHELRTPLTSIAGYLELLQDGDAGELTVQQKGMLTVIGRSTARLRGLIEDVMMLNRIEGGVSKGSFVEVSIRALIGRVVEELRPLAQTNGVELDIDAGSQSAIVLGDRSSLERAVVNILSNAIKFSHRGGVVSVNGALDEESRRVIIICHDRGLGIPEQDRADLFTRFFRASNATDQSIPGTGLGLSIAKQIVEDHHGGELKLMSVEGEGTTVVIDLPLYEVPQAQLTAESVGNDSRSDDVFGIRG